MNPLFNELIGAVYKFIKDLDDPHLNSLLADWPHDVSQSRSVIPGDLPVLSWMPAAVSAAHESSAHIVKLLASLATGIAWGQTYSVEDFGSGFLERYGWTELIGLRGPIASERIASGFLMLGPDIEYPKHSHEAEEVYVPVRRSGCGETKTGSCAHPAGQFIMPPECRTLCEPKACPCLHFISGAEATSSRNQESNRTDYLNSKLQIPNLK